MPDDNFYYILFTLLQLVALLMASLIVWFSAVTHTGRGGKSADAFTFLPFFSFLSSLLFSSFGSSFSFFLLTFFAFG